MFLLKQQIYLILITLILLEFHYLEGGLLWVLNILLIELDVFNYFKNRIILKMSLRIQRFLLGEAIFDRLPRRPENIGLLAMTILIKYFLIKVRLPPNKTGTTPRQGE